MLSLCAKTDVESPMEEKVGRLTDKNNVNFFPI